MRQPSFPQKTYTTTFYIDDQFGPDTLEYILKFCQSNNLDLDKAIVCSKSGSIYHDLCIEYEFTNSDEDFAKMVAAYKINLDKYFEENCIGNIIK